MHRLILLRHAKSAYPLGVVDHDRPLSARGERNASCIATRLRQFLPADAAVQAVVSPARRTQQTWSIVNEHMSIPHWTDSSLYLAEPETINEVASIIDADVGIIVGHNPGLELLALDLAAGALISDPITGASLQDKFPTSAFAVIDSVDPILPWTMSTAQCVAFAVCR
jgi:phosphohistidine phosphatase